jgi:formylglycine-generating enzyme required for sulfatase activity
VTSTVAVYGDPESTSDVKSNKPNALGIYDMNGNAAEWCFEWHPKFVSAGRIIRGGAYASDPGAFSVGHVASINQFAGYIFLGFRFFRNK